MQIQLLQDTICANFQAKRTGFWGRNFEKLNLDADSTPPIYHMCKFSGKTDNFDFFGPNLPKKWILRSEFRDSKSGFRISTSNIHECQLDNFEIFGLNLGKLPNYVRYFDSYNVEGVAESWVEVEKSWVEVNGTGWR